MKKLKLNLDEIKVESFETNSIQSKLGTVLGLNGSGICPNLPEPGSGRSACHQNSGCNETCNNTCWVTCFESCDIEICTGAPIC